MSEQTQTGHYGDLQYALEYVLKGETIWRRTMSHPIGYLKRQEDMLWENKSVAATRLVAYCDFSRLLTPEELLQASEVPA